MEKNQKPSEEVNTEADVEWAYNVLSAIKEAMDKSAGDLEGSNQLMHELINDLPDILEAFIMLVGDEHKQLVVGVVGSWVKMMRSVKRT